MAGYGANRSDIPEAIRLGILNIIAFNYEHRGDFEGGITATCYGTNSLTALQEA